jgi:predicted nucleic acid-binding protein
MSVVVDASLLVVVTTDNGPGGVWAEEVLLQGGVVAPHLVLVEATNILRRLASGTSPGGSAAVS